MTAVAHLEIEAQQVWIIGLQLVLAAQVRTHLLETAHVPLHSSEADMVAGESPPFRPRRSDALLLICRNERLDQARIPSHLRCSRGDSARPRGELWRNRRARGVARTGTSGRPRAQRNAERVRPAMASYRSRGWPPRVHAWAARTGTPPARRRRGRAQWPRAHHCARAASRSGSRDLGKRVLAAQILPSTSSTMMMIRMMPSRPLGP